MPTQLELSCIAGWAWGAAQTGLACSAGRGDRSLDKWIAGRLYV